MPYRKFTKTQVPPANIANLLKRGENTRPARDTTPLGESANGLLTLLNSPGSLAAISNGLAGVSTPLEGATNPVQDGDTENGLAMLASLAGGDPEIEISRATPTRDADTTGCPTHWLRTPDLPPKGSRVAMQDEGGYGCVYKFRMGGRWYVVKFLPPFDGRVSLRDEAGKTWVLPGLEYVPAAVGLLGLLKE